MRKWIGFLLMVWVFTACKGPSTAVSPATTLSEAQVRKFDAAFFEGLKHKSLEQLPEALRSFEKALEIDPQEAAVHYEMAQVYLLQDRADKARISAERAVALDQSNEWYSILLVSIYEWQRAYDLQAALYEQMLRANPGNADYLYDLAITYLQLNEPLKAIDAYNRLEKSIGITADVSHHKKQIYLSVNQLDKAIGELQKLIAHQPEKAEHHLSLAQLLLSNDRQEDAVGEMNKALELKLNGRDALTLGDFYWSLGEQAKALKSYERAFGDPNVALQNKVNSIMRGYSSARRDSALFHELLGLTQLAVNAHPTAPEAHSLRADFLLMDARYSEARDALEACVSNGGNTYEVWFEYVLSSSNLKDWPRMVRDASSAIDLFPVQATFYYLKGVAHQELMEYEAARSVYEDGLNYTLDNVNLSLNFLTALGEVCHRLQEYPASDRFFEQALALDSNNALVLNNYAWYLALRGDRLDRAEMLSARCNLLSPNNGTYLDTYAWVFYRAGDFVQALEKIERALEYGGRSSGEILDHYGDILWTLNRWEEAKSAWQQALELEDGREDGREGILQKLDRDHDE